MRVGDGLDAGHPDVQVLLDGGVGNDRVARGTHSAEGNGLLQLVEIGRVIHSDVGVVRAASSSGPGVGVMSVIECS